MASLKLLSWPLIVIWFTTSCMTILTGFLFLNYHQNLLSKKNNSLISSKNSINHYQLYASFPQVLGETHLNAKVEDAIPTLIKNYLTKYRSPMLTSAESLIKIAQDYHVDPLLLVAIAQCESNLGKKMPPDCYNPFGWGIHSEGTLCFENWEKGYEVVAKGIKEKYINKGLRTPEEIMQKYNLNSLQNAEGAWAKCVRLTLEEIQNQK